MRDFTILLRDIDLEIEQIKARKEELKKRLLEHRSQTTEEEFRQIKAEKESLEKQIKEKEERREKIIADAEKEEIENRGENDNMIMNNELLHFKDSMDRAEVISTVEYRTAFFKNLQKRTLSDVEQRAMTSAANSGGAAIPTYTMKKIIGQLKESATLLGLINLQNIPGLLSLPKEDVVNDATWVSEGADSTPSDDRLTSLSFAAYTVIKTIKITAQLREMAVDAFEEWIVNVITRKIRAACDKAVIKGTGSGQPKGLDSSTWTKGTNAVEYASGGSVSYDDLVEAESLVGEDFITSAVWVMNRKTKAIIAKLKDEQKRPLFERAVENGFVGTLLGYPVRLDKNVSDGEAYFGDWESAYVMNFSKNVTIDSSDQAGFMSASTVYRGYALVDGKPTDVEGAMVKIKAGA